MLGRREVQQIGAALISGAVVGFADSARLMVMGVAQVSWWALVWAVSACAGVAWAGLLMVAGRGR